MQIIGTVLIGLGIGVLVLGAAAWGAAFLMWEALKIVVKWFERHA